MLKRIVHLFFMIGVLSGMAQAQVRTNASMLNQMGRDYTARDQANYARAMSLAKQKGWPLTILNNKGNVGVLVGVDGNDFPKYYIPNNNTTAAATTRANQLWPGGSTGLNLSGSTANMKNKLGVWDGGRPLATHVELTGRITQKDNPPRDDDHATHVTGTLIASGVNPNAKGMAFGIQGIHAYDFTGDIGEISSDAANLVVSNHSYSVIAGWNFNSVESRWEFNGRPNENEDFKFGYYSNDAQALDSIAYNAPFYLIVKSAGNNRDENGPAEGQPYFRRNTSGVMAAAGNRPPGISSNDGYNIISWDGNAKNILTVGAVNGLPGGYSRKEDVVLSRFSSWGPTDDGRIKPDVVADGVGVLSPVASSSTSYASLSGTSMSSPNAAGSLFLLQEYYSKIKSGAFMRSASLKGLAIHTANEAGGTPGPDYQHGWGLLNVERAAMVMMSAVVGNNADTCSHRLYENVRTNGDAPFTLDVIASGRGPLTATIAWTDVKGDVEPQSGNVLNNPAKKLVNDLDIRITRSTSTFRPWTLDPAVPSNAALQGDNITDNVERIDVDSTVPGQTYRITITHKGSLARNAQAYSLILSGVGGTAFCNSAPTSNTGSRIDSVSFKTLRIANPAGNTTYTDNTRFVANIEASQTIPIFVRVGSSDASNANKIVKVFIDYNNNRSFEANELAATSGVLTNGGTFTGNITTPADLVIGNITLMRIVLQETSTAADVNACGSYGKGETQDYRIRVVEPTTDLAISEITTPKGLDCADGEQFVTLKIRNNGTLAQTNILITAIVRNGATTVASFTTTYPGPLQALSTGTFTIQTPFASTPGTTYTITATVSLGADQNTANNSLTATSVTSATPAAPAGTAVICNNNASLKVTSPSAGTNYFWYTSPTATNPIASGASTTTSTIPANNTYYVGAEARGFIGPANKMVFTDGGYNNFRGNFMKFNNSVPIVIESARLYIGNPGTITFTVGNIITTNADGSFTFSVLSTTTLDVYATNPNPQPSPVDANGNPTGIAGNPANDPGAVFYLNLPVDQTGDHILIASCDQGGATIFRNNNIPGANTYPFTLPGIMTITGNSVNTTNPPQSAFYYFFYNMKITTGKCVSNRAAVVGTVPPIPTVTKITTANGDSLVSSIATGNQWFLENNLIPGATDQKFKPTASGNYKVIVTDASGCQNASASFNFTITASVDVVAEEIKLQVSPNPSRGIFNLSFEVAGKHDLNIDILSASGQNVYATKYAGFSGKFNRQIQLNRASSEFYVLKIQHNKKTYVKKLIMLR